MSHSDKNILITPNRGSTTDDPTIELIGADATTAGKTILMKVYPTSNGTVSFEGTQGQLFSITDDLSGVIFSVNDISGIPSIEVNANGTIKLAEYAGNVGIRISNPTEALHVNGNILASGDITAFSDIALKENVSTLSDCLNIVEQLRGVSYASKDTKEKRVGLVAQELEQFVPELVKTHNNGLKSVAYGNVVALLIEAIKELSHEVKKLKNERGIE